MGKYHDDRVAGRQNVHRGHHADVGVRHGALFDDSRIRGNGFPEKQRIPSTMVLPDIGETNKQCSLFTFFSFLTFIVTPI